VKHVQPIASDALLLVLAPNAVQVLAWTEANVLLALTSVTDVTAWVLDSVIQMVACQDG